MRPAWLEPGRDWKERLAAFTPEDVAWLDLMWEPTERKSREVDITPDPFSSSGSHDDPRVVPLPDMSWVETEMVL